MEMSFTVACYQKFHFRKHRVEFAVVDGVKNKYCLMLRTGPLETKCATFRLVNIHAATRNLTDCVDTVIVRPVTESAIRTNPQSPLEKGFRLIWAAKPPNNKAGNRIKTECGCREMATSEGTSVTSVARWGLWFGAVLLATTSLVYSQVTWTPIYVGGHKTISSTLLPNKSKFNAEESNDPDTFEETNLKNNSVNEKISQGKDVIDLSTSRHRSKWTATPGIVKFNAKTLDRNVDDELVDALVYGRKRRFESEVEKPEYLEEGWKKGGGRNRRVKGKGEWEEG
ncbi:cubilin-like [Vespula maculifrons]|uniref:Cubilin-like n=1 Tax=Vespula maculifrons TaxID=7453 RepID=A0ABD2CE47_VESMC